ncbi:hypothetical protein HMPREF1991_01532 [Hoylesella loescheii DSM 19665 = JCM 12249 = ATCC 15930]|uniref:Uncharacterized protein n=2 Tax=Hoylesella loescheii TaxID=840 RepID=A0A069QHT7_HOYLO|nr:hypothetical protein [Hoylesella loescheii]KDR52350.1 hypothetical protein HMPREF1991_01532 [Hoylesella loescheii DSM 19665 = JCM 12249 = ATCC 15930]
MDKKVIVLMSRTFPLGSSRAGEETGFKASISDGRKIHTIRDNFAVWANKLDAIKKGGHVLSLRQWAGRPYNSPQVEILRTKEGVGYQSTMIRYDHKNNFIVAKVGDAFVPINTLAKNDGLSVEDFKEWIFGKNPQESKLFKGIVIHFTPFRY